MNKITFLFIWVVFISCSNSDTTDENITPTSDIEKPKGLYTSSFNNTKALDNNEVKGGLIRVRWDDIEPFAGIYDFSSIDEQKAILESKNLKWSLGVIAGNESPEWLIEDLGVAYFDILFRATIEKRIPKVWDPMVNQRFKLLADALAAKYNNDDSLVLVYVPQMTANGIEGHFNGVTTDELTNAGLTPKNWVNSVKETAKIFANAFSNKAVAVEVHDIMNDTSIPNQIMTDLWHDAALNHRVGAAVWWFSGKTNYQPNLINALKNFSGDIYAQAIGRSDQTERFENDDYTSIFTQAKTLNVRYIELWEYEFLNMTYPDEFNDFNSYVDSVFD